MLLAGIDILQRGNFSSIRGQRVGLLSNAGTIDRSHRYTADIFRKEAAGHRFKLTALFGPQHGLWGHTQDNMVEWEGDKSLSIPTYSLYGANREPTSEMLEGMDTFVVDIPDVGARYYTFIWTMGLIMKACSERGIRVLVLDRPNPIGGTQVEGMVLDPAYSSFVGLFPLPTRHGLTAGEIARYLKAEVFPNTRLEVIECEGWVRSDYGDQSGYPWAMPSPNMPTVDTAVVYPGQCLLEATNLSEGRGTTRPFETFGAPWLDGWKLADTLNGLGLKGVYFRPAEFQPTFQKHWGKVCQGAAIHVTDRSVFEPVLASVAILQACRAQNEAEFSWNQPPYEYEYVKLPIDILAGNGWLRPAIEGQTPIKEIRERIASECTDWLQNHDFAAK